MQDGPETKEKFPLTNQIHFIKRNIFQAVSFSIARGNRIKRNGCKKTTNRISVIEFQKI